MSASIPGVWFASLPRFPQRANVVHNRVHAMGNSQAHPRRSFLKSASFALAAAGGSRFWFPTLTSAALAARPLDEFSYSDVSIASELHGRQLRESQAVLMSLSEDILLKPFRQMAGQPAPGEDLGG